MNCPNCGSQLTDDTTFCAACGTPITPQSAGSQNVNDALFNSAPAYSSTPVAPAKKSNPIGIIVGVIAAVAIIFVLGFFVLGGRYNGTYEFVSMSMFGAEYDIDQLSELYGESITMDLKVTFRTCTLDMDALGYNDSGKCKIKISGDEVTLTDASETMTGTYDSAEKTITLDVEGIQMVFKKK